MTESNLFSGEILIVSQKKYNFAVADRQAEARSGFERRYADIMKAFT